MEDNILGPPGFDQDEIPEPDGIPQEIREVIAKIKEITGEDPMVIDGSGSFAVTGNSREAAEKVQEVLKASGAELTTQKIRIMLNRNGGGVAMLATGSGPDGSAVMPMELAWKLGRELQIAAIKDHIAQCDDPECGVKQLLESIEADEKDDEAGEMGLRPPL